MHRKKKHSTPQFFYRVCARVESIAVTCHWSQAKDVRARRSRRVDPRAGPAGRGYGVRDVSVFTVARTTARPGSSLSRSSFARRTMTITATTRCCSSSSGTSMRTRRQRPSGQNLSCGPTRQIKSPTRPLATRAPPISPLANARKKKKPNKNTEQNSVCSSSPPAGESSLDNPCALQHKNHSVS